MPQSRDPLIHIERPYHSSDVSEPEAVPDWFSLLLDTSVSETDALGTPAPAGEDLSDAECADGDNEVNDETFGLDLTAGGPHAAPLPQFFQDQPLYVQMCQFSPPDGWEAALWNLKEHATPHAPAGKLWIATSGLDFFRLTTTNGITMSKQTQTSGPANRYGYW